jgi:hypothetical protein
LLAFFNFPVQPIYLPCRLICKTTKLMKSIAKILLAAVLLTGASYTFAKPNQTVVADSAIDRHLTGFTSIKIAGPFEVHITQGSAESVKFDAPAELVDRIVTEVNNGVLEIHNKHDNWGWGEKSWWSDKSVWHNHKRIVVNVIAKDLNAISISGSGHASFNEGLNTNTLSLRVRGSGSMEGKVQAKTLESMISGSGNIKLSGTADNSTVKLSGSGNFSARDLVTASSTAQVSGSGSAQVNASEKVDAAISGSGGVSYTGAAKVVNSKKSGSGAISRY